MRGVLAALSHMHQRNQMFVYGVLADENKEMKERFFYV